jgi:pilus assembly protein CpaB
MRRRQAVAMLGASAICAGLALSAVDRYADDVEARVGPPVRAVVAVRDIPRGRVVTPALAATTLAESEVPRRFAPPGALRSRAKAVGLETSSALAAGDYVGRLQLRPPRGGRGASARWSGDTRLVEVAVAGVRTIAEALRTGGVVDVLITTERGGTPRTFLALQRVPVAGFEAGEVSSAGEGSAAADGRVTLRVTLRQAILLTAAENFAREVRVVPRAPGDTRRLGPTSVAAAGLGS